MTGYLYDGSFDGFLSCVFESFARKEQPVLIQTFDQDQPFLMALTTIVTRPERARRVENGLKRLSNDIWEMVRDGFLCDCMNNREVNLLRLIQQLFKYGPSAAVNYADPVVSTVWKALRHMREEGHLLSGFVRFSEYNGVLVSVISPKNQVLPLLAQHFSVRFPGEQFMIYDQNHKVAFIHTAQKGEFVEIDTLTLPSVGKEEAAFRAMWREYFDHIAIPQRENPFCQRTHLALRYRPWMTEFTAEQPDGQRLPG